MTSFTQYNSPRMPPEIQNLIWFHAIEMYPSRTIELRNQKDAQFPDPDPEAKANMRPCDLALTAHAPIPNILHVCSRSREMAQKRWTLSFGGIGEVPQTEASNPILRWSRAPKVWFDFARDRLFFIGSQDGFKPHYKTSEITTALPLAEREKVRNVGVHAHTLGLTNWGMGGAQAAKELSIAFPKARNVCYVFPGSYATTLRLCDAVVPFDPGEIRTSGQWHVGEGTIMTKLLVARGVFIEGSLKIVRREP